MVPGIFLGYKLHSGHVWHGEYFVANLDEFADLNFRVSACAAEHSRVRIQTVREVRMMDSSWVFPLRERCDKGNRTLEGVRSRLVPDADAFNCPTGDAQRVAEADGRDLSSQMLGDDNADGDKALPQDQHRAGDAVPQRGGRHIVIFINFAGISQPRQHPQRRRVDRNRNRMDAQTPSATT